MTTRRILALPDALLSSSYQSAKCAPVSLTSDVRSIVNRFINMTTRALQANQIGSRSKCARMRSVSRRPIMRSYHDLPSDDDWAHSGDPESACELLKYAPSCSIVTRLFDSKSRRSRTALPWENCAPTGRRAWNFENPRIHEAERHDALSHDERADEAARTKRPARATKIIRKTSRLLKCAFPRGLSPYAQAESRVRHIHRRTHPYTTSC